MELTRIFRLYLTIFISAVPDKWSKSCDLAWLRYTRREGFPGPRHGSMMVSAV